MIFAHKDNPSSDDRTHGGGPYSLRGTTITLEDCTGNDFAATFGLEASATVTCATNSVCGVEAECADSPMFVDTVTGAVSDARTTAVCSCGGQMARYAWLALPFTQAPLPKPRSNPRCNQ